MEVGNESKMHCSLNVSIAAWSAQCSTLDLFFFHEWPARQACWAQDCTEALFEATAATTCFTHQSSQVTAKCNIMKESHKKPQTVYVSRIANATGG